MPQKAAAGKAGAKKGRGAMTSNGQPAIPPPVLSVKKPQNETDVDRIPALAALLSTSANPRRAEYAKKFEALVELILSTDSTYRIGMRNRNLAASRGAPIHSVAGAITLTDDYFPTLQAGFLARAMGLNLTEEQVVHLVELVEDDTASRGTVSRRRLQGVVIDALITGVLGGPTLVSAGVLTTSALPAGWQPSCCLREDEETVYAAFAALDGTGKGYLTPDELRLAMTSMGDPLSTEEMEEMFVAITEPGSTSIYYRDFASILARE